jgi:hypothetical protein
VESLLHLLRKRKRSNSKPTYLEEVCTLSTIVGLTCAEFNDFESSASEEPHPDEVYVSAEEYSDEERMGDFVVDQRGEYQGSGNFVNHSFNLTDAYSARNASKNDRNPKTLRIHEFRSDANSFGYFRDH